MNLEKEMRAQSLLSFQETLFEVAQVQQCEDVEMGGGSPGKKIVLVLDAEGRKRFPMYRLTFWIAPEADTLHKVLLEYPVPRKIDCIEITFNAIDYNYKTNALVTSILSLIFDQNGDLLPKYKAFKVIDRRKRQRKPFEHQRNAP